MPASDAVRDLADRLRLDAQVEPFREHCWTPAAAQRRVLHLEDVSAIPFLTQVSGVAEYQHRARVRAEPGDLYATVTPPDAAYETYCRERLLLGGARWLETGGGGDGLAIARGCSAGDAFERLAGGARRAGGLTIHPYMSTEDVWALAARLSAAGAVPVSVLGPPPPVTWIANDKALFAELVERVLGPGWMPESHTATSAEECTAMLRALAAGHAGVGLKRTRCASGTGNLVLEAAWLNAQTPEAAGAAVRAFLDRTDWQPPEPVLAVAWEEAAASPSTQWWLPAAEEGPPRLDGIYEQILAGEERVFVGSRPSTLPAPVNRALAGTSREVAGALQALGYVGRCSFDHLVLGDPQGDFTVVFTECNGRWGGTSTPMHLVDRVVAGPRPPYRAQDFVHDGLLGAGFGDVLERVGGEAFDARTQTGRFIFYNVGPLRGCGKLDVIALGATQAEAERAMTDDLPRLLGLQQHDMAASTADRRE